MIGDTNSQQGLGSNVGSDTNPIKIVNGQAVAVTNNLATSCGASNSTSTLYLVGRTAQSTGTSYSNSSVKMTGGVLKADLFNGPARLPFAVFMGGVYNDIAASTSCTKIGFTTAPTIYNSAYFEQVENASPYYAVKILKAGWYLVSMNIYGHPDSVANGRLEVAMGYNSNLEETYTISLAGATGSGNKVSGSLTKLDHFAANSTVCMTGWYSNSKFVVTGTANNTNFSIMCVMPD